MKPFEYLEPRSLDEACSLLSKYKGEAKILAGGQSLVSLLKHRLISPSYIINIKGLVVALPAAPKDVYKRSKTSSEQYWERNAIPKSLERITSIFQWNEKPTDFKNLWVDYIEGEFDKRELGYWFMNNGKPTYVTGAHYMYLQWTSIDVGYPDYREANRILYIYWEACKADKRSFGMDYLKIRRSGFSFMSSSECVNTGTLAKDGCRC